MIGYMTEKLPFAFLDGCLPIYYESDEVFSMFDPKAFIYYDVNDPEPVLADIWYLKANQDAYWTRMAESPLLKGNQTLEEYFYVSDDGKNGIVKKCIRSWLGIDRLIGR